MANEITVTSSLSYVNIAADIPVVNLAIKSPGKFTITGTDFIKASMTVPTTAGGTAIPLGSIGTLGWFEIRNNDPTNYVEIYNAVAGTKFLKILPNGVAQGYFASTVTAPAAIANTAAVSIEYLILEA